MKKILTILLAVIIAFSSITGATVVEAASKNTIKTSISKIEGKAKGFKVTWKKKGKIKGYQIQYSTSSKFKKSSTKTKTISKAKTASTSISKLKGCNKKYYVRVRTYKVSKGKKVYSAWSKAKKVTTLKHKYSKATCKKAKVCKYCKKTVGKKKAHNYKKGKCELCGSKPTTTTKPITHTHSYSGATCTTPAKCSCGATNGSALGHSYSNATCTESQKCSRCGVTSGSKLGHKIVVDKPVVATCTKTGLTEGSHCSVCNTIIKAQQTISPNGHNAVIDRAVAATCTRNGLTEGSHCSVCHTIIVAQKTTGLTAHSYGPAITVYNATCTSTGQIYYSCSSCGYKLYYTTSKTSHNYQNVRVYQAGLGWVYRQQCTVCGRGK